MIDIKKFMAKPVITITKDKNIETAAKLMVKKDVSCLIIVSKTKKPLGIITERDLIKKHLAEGRNHQETKVADIMTKKLFTSSPKTTIINISKLMHKCNVKRIPIVEKNKLIGIITATDIAHLMAGEK